MKADQDWLRDLFEPFAPISFRRMFGGTGLYRDGLIFGLAIDDGIYLKTDAESAEAFRAAGSKPFTYVRKDGRRAEMTYVSLPDEALDDPDRLVEWAELAYASALRAQALKKR